MEAQSGLILVTTGMLPALVLAAAALTAPVTLALLWLYRRAVIRAMAGEGGSAAHPVEVAGPAGPPAEPLRVTAVAAGAPPGDDAALRVRARRSLARATVVYVSAGLAYAGVLASAWMVFTPGGFLLTRFLWLLSCYAWPTALAAGMIAAIDTRQRLAVAAVYFAMLFAVALTGLFRNAELSVAQLAAFWLYTNLPASLLLAAFLHRRVRAAGPLVLAFMVLGVTGSQVAVSLAGGDDRILRATVRLGESAGLDAGGILIALLLAGFAAFATVGWRVLLWLGRRYRERRTSDQAITLDAMWLLFGVVQSITLAFEGWGWVFTGVVAFAVYKAVSVAGFRLAGLDRGRRTDATLLLLRVFALGARSERLYDALSKRWLRAGRITMIAGPDLVTSTVEPHEFLDFVGGRLSRRFIRGEDDLCQRLAAAPVGRDPDGRHRVDEYFCHADTWQATMVALAERATAVLMDLRGFSPSNQGCLYELGRLLDRVPLARTVFVVDATTDRAFLEASLRSLWAAIGAESPNRGTRAPQAMLVELGDLRAGAVDRLLGRLYAIADS